MNLHFCLSRFYVNLCEVVVRIEIQYKCYNIKNFQLALIKVVLRKFGVIHHQKASGKDMGERILK